MQDTTYPPQNVGQVLVACLSRHIESRRVVGIEEPALCGFCWCLQGVHGGVLMLRVLVIDDEEVIRTLLSAHVEALQCHVTCAPTADAALAAATQCPFDLAFLDLRLGESSGLDLIAPLLATRPDLGILMLTAYRSFDTAVEALRLGAQDYLTKPYSIDQIQVAVEKAAPLDAEQIADRIIGRCRCLPHWSRWERLPL